MKKILLCLLILFSGKVFSQTDSLKPADDIYTVSFLSISKEEENLSAITITDIDKDALSFEKIYTPGNNITPTTKKSYKVNLENINEFGYRVSTNVAGRMLVGALIGGGSMTLLGYVATGIGGSSAHSVKPLNPTLTIVVPAIIGTLAGGIIGAIIASGSRDYETIDLSKYSKEKKYEVIKGLIKKGIIYNKDQ
jgi:hypothetical protein